MTKNKVFLMMGSLLVALPLIAPFVVKGVGNFALCMLVVGSILQLMCVPKYLKCKFTKKMIYPALSTISWFEVCLGSGGEVFFFILLLIATWITFIFLEA